MADEILNIEYHLKRLVQKALERSATNEEAARLLGVSIRSLYHYKNRFNLSNESQPVNMLVKEKAA